MTASAQLKEQGQLLAIQHAGQSWTDHAMTLLADFLRDEAGDVFRWEQFRAYALFRGLPQPPSPNAWGSLPRIAAKRGLIVATGRYEAARSERTHAHPVMLWRAA